jgi:hypothetical protein
MKTQKFIVARGRFAINNKAYEFGQIVELSAADVARIKDHGVIGNTLEPYKDPKKTPVAPAANAPGNTEGDNSDNGDGNVMPPAPPVGADNTGNDLLTQTRAKYVEVFGKEPHPQAKVETLQKAITAQEQANTN